MNLASLVLLTAVFASQASTADTGLAQALAQCRAIQAPDSRLDCYDGLAAPEPSPRSQAPAQIAPKTEVTQPNFGLSEQEHEPPPRLTAEVASVRSNRARRQIIELANGQVWRQADSARLRLKPGDSVEIESGALGSFLLRKVSGGGSMRIQRLK